MDTRKIVTDDATFFGVLRALESYWGREWNWTSQFSPREVVGIFLLA